MLQKENWRLVLSLNPNLIFSLMLQEVKQFSLLSM